MRAGKRRFEDSFGRGGVTSGSFHTRSWSDNGNCRTPQAFPVSCERRPAENPWRNEWRAAGDDANSCASRLGWASGAVVSAAVLHTVGRGFESLLAHQLLLPVSTEFQISPDVSVLTVFGMWHRSWPFTGVTANVGSGHRNFFLPSLSISVSGGGRRGWDQKRFRVRCCWDLAAVNSNATLGTVRDFAV